MKLITIFLFSIVTFIMPSKFILASTIDDLGKSTVFLREQSQYYELKGNKKFEIWLRDPINKEYQPKLNANGGTGFLTLHNGKIYLVTAAHVASKLSKNAEVLWNTASGEMKKFTFELINRKLPEAQWFFHPSADIAVHSFGFSEKSDHMLIPEKIYWNTEKEISLGREVYILGYPMFLGVDNFLSPIAKGAKVASWFTSIDRPNIDKELVFILLDEDLASGYSGAPVFTSPNPRFQGNALVSGDAKLLGLQSMTMSDKTGGKISLVVPIKYLQEIFEMDSFKEFENKIRAK